MKDKIKRLLLLQAICLFSIYIVAQPPSGYYDPAAGLTGQALQNALHGIIDGHTVLTYDYLWTAFQTTDKRADGKVWDMYSDIPSGTAPYLYTFGTNQCGNYSGENDCYNREHSFPKSWFNDGSPMVTDLFHIYPTDGYVNGKRSNYSFGEVSSVSWTSLNGSKLGTCSVTGYTGTDPVFEPIDAFKGDFARTYFYMATRYYGEDSGWPGSNMVTGSQPKSWALAMLLKWHRNDPVSQKETDRNNAVYALQKNRNPFIDNPAYVEMIWGNLNSSDELEADNGKLVVYPNPASDKLNYILPQNSTGETVIQIYDLNGCLAMTLISGEQQSEINISGLTPGYYILQATNGTKQHSTTFIKE